MSPLGPFKSPPRLALAVSGGADSLSLALLGDRWARSRGGSVLALIVEHGLRPESKAEAATTAARLQERGIPVRILPLTGLRPGPALAERARDARFAALETACSESGAPPSPAGAPSRRSGRDGADAPSGRQRPLGSRRNGGGAGNDLGACAPPVADNSTRPAPRNFAHRGNGMDRRPLECRSAMAPLPPARVDVGSGRNRTGNHGAA